MIDPSPALSRSSTSRLQKTTEAWHWGDAGLLYSIVFSFTNPLTKL